MYDVINYIDCTEQQLLEILKLRNLDEVRKWMVNDEIIGNEDHFKFVDRLRDDSKHCFLAVYKDGLLKGTFNLTKVSDGVWERGIIANPITKKKGDTEKWEHYLHNELIKKGVKTLTAKVKLDNLRSIRYHEKVGYRERSRDDEYIYYNISL